MSNTAIKKICVSRFNFYYYTDGTLQSLFNFIQSKNKNIYFTEKPLLQYQNNKMSDMQLLKDPRISPMTEILEAELGNEVFELYASLIKMITGPGIDLNPEWNYYKDGKAWLCKVSYRKKTVFWLSAWENHLKASFYFTEKTRWGVFELPLHDEIKRDFNGAKPFGKLIPMTLRINNVGQLDDVREIIKYKKMLN